SECTGVAGGEVEGVDLGELVPGEGVAAFRVQALAEHRDGALRRGVEEREGAPRGLSRANRGLHADTQLLELPPRALAELVVPERREERALARKPRELDRRHRPAAGGQRPVPLGSHDLARRWHALEEGELAPLD